MTSACNSCKGCPICSDPFKAQRKQTMIRFLDQLVTWQDGPHKKGRGYHIKLLFDKDKLARVDEGKSQALRRLLSTERMLTRPEFAAARQYFNAKVKDCITKAYITEPKNFHGDLEGHTRCYQPYSLALKY